MTRVEAVLFDLDGTLVDTNIDFPLMRSQMLALAREHGVNETDLAGMDILGIIDHAVEALVASGIEESARNLRKRAMAILEEIELRHAAATQRVPHANDLLAKLKSKNVPVGIVTRNCRRASRMSLDIVGIQPDALVCREDSKRHKPHPEPVLLALKQLGAQSERAVMVGDHLMDIQSGKAAGIKTIGFLRENRPDDFFGPVAPDVVVRSLSEVMDAIIDRNS